MDLSSGYIQRALPMLPDPGHAVSVAGQTGLLVQREAADQGRRGG